MRILDRHASIDFRKKNLGDSSWVGARPRRSSSLSELPGQNRRAQRATRGEKILECYKRACFVVMACLTAGRA
jgi:hypothetical protein